MISKSSIVDARYISPIKTKLLEITQIGPSRAGVLEIPKNYWPKPGQYLPCQNLSGDHEVLPSQLFRVRGIAKDQLNLAPLPDHWDPGDHIAVQPPQGKGFDLPGSARRLGLLSLSTSPLYLLALVRSALNQGAAISLFCEVPPHQDILNHLPTSVEVSPLTSLQDNLDWPDFLAVDVNMDELGALSALFGQGKLHCPGQVLIHTPMPCRGLGECGVCAVETRHGWRMACVDGPVFPLQEVLHVA